MQLRNHIADTWKTAQTQGQAYRHVLLELDVLLELGTLRFTCDRQC